MKLKLCILLVLLVGCESRTMLPKTTGTEYFPLAVGMQWTYSMVETTITQVGGQSTSTYDLKVHVTDSLIVGGQLTHILQRYRRVDATQPWTSLDTWSARKEPYRVIIQQGNTPFVKLLFPLSESKSWDGNAMNDLGGKDKCSNGVVGCDNYVVSQLAKPFQLGPLSYENSVTILENNQSDPIVGQDVRKAIYAKAVGLAYYESTVLIYCTVGSCIGKQVIETGSIVKQTLIDYAAH